MKKTHREETTTKNSESKAPSAGMTAPDHIFAIVNNLLELVYFNDSFSKLALLATGNHVDYAKSVFFYLPDDWRKQFEVGFAQANTNKFFEDYLTLKLPGKTFESSYHVRIQLNITANKQEGDFIIEITDHSLNKTLERCFGNNGDIETCLNFIVNEWSEQLGQCAGEVWIMDHNNMSMRLAAMQIDGQSINYSDIDTFTESVGLPWLANSKDELVFIENLEQNPAYIRKEFARQNNFFSATAIPIKNSNQKYIGTIIFYSRTSDAPAKANLPSAIVKLLGMHLEQRITNDNIEQLFNYSPDLLSIVNLKGIFTKVNPAFSKLLGYSEEELISQPFFNFMHPSDVANTKERLANIALGKQVKSFQNRYLTKNGKVKWISWNSSQKSKDGFVYAFGKDVTEEKNLEELNNEIAKSARFGAWEYSLKAQSLYTSPGIKIIFETDEERFTNLENLFNYLKEGRDREAFRKLVFDSINTKTHWEEEFLIHTQQGNERWVLMLGHSEHINGECVRILGSIQDIHERKVAELKASDLLQEKNNILESIGDGFISMDNDWKITYWNNYLENLTGQKKSEMVGKIYWDTLPERHNNIRAICEHAKKTELAQTTQIIGATAGKWYDLYAYPHSYGMSLFVKDISERKLSEEKVRYANERFELMAKATNNVIWEYDFAANRMIVIGEAFEKMLGYPASAVENPDFTDSLVHPDDFPGLLKYKMDFINDASTNDAQYEYRILTKHRGYIYVFVQVIILRDENGKAVKLIGSTQDVNERKTAELNITNLLRERNNILESIGHGFLAMDNDFKITYWNHQLETLSSIKREQVLGKSCLEFSNQPYFEKVMALVREAIESGKSKFALIYKIVDDSSFEIYAYPYTLGISVFVKDVTAQINADEKLREANERFEQMAKTTNNVIWEYDFVADRMTMIGEGFTNMLGYPATELENPDFLDSIVHPDDLPGLSKYKMDSINNASTNVMQAEYRIKTKNRGYIYVYVKAIIMRDTHGHAMRMIGSTQDVHERKTAELNISKLLHERDNILESIGDGFLSMDNDWKITYWNWQFELATNKNRKDALGRAYWEVLPKEFYDDMHEICEHAKESGQSSYIELKYNARNVWYGLSVYPYDYGLSIFIKDITERINAGEKLRVANERFELMAKATNVVIWEYDFVANKTITIGDGFEDMLGYPTKQIENPAFIDSLIHPDELPALQAEKANAINNTSITEIEQEYQINTKHRGYIYVFVKVVILRDADGRPIRLIGSTQDVHKRKMAELRAAKLLEERDNILESIGDGFVSMDNDWRITYWNNYLERLTGQERSELLGKTFWDTIRQSQTHQDIFSICQMAKETGTSQNAQIVGMRADSWYDINVYPHSYGLSIFLKDVTERIHTEERIRITNERFELLARASNDAIWDIDFNTDFLSMIGDGYTKLLGYPNTDRVSTEHLRSLVHKDDIANLMEQRMASLADTSKSSAQFEYRLLSQNRGYIYVVERAVIIRDEKGKATRAVGILQDVTEQREYENSLRELNTKIERYAKNLAASNAELEQFAYVASHDLQEPLRMVSSFMSLLEKSYSDKLDDRGKQFIHFAVDGAQRMKKIIVDLLEYSRVNRFSKEKEDVDLNEIVNQSTSLMRSLINEKKAIFHIAPLPVIYSHRTPLQQIFQNLIGNALKYTTPGVSPEVTIAYEDRGTEHYISIADNGIGIDPAYSEKIFGLFYRLNPRSEYEGTGLGLSVCKRIIETLGGRIWVDSEPGKGSNFQFTIPKLV